mgnify:CR=1 FL=1
MLSAAKVQNDGLSDRIAASEAWQRVLQALQVSRLGSQNGGAAVPYLCTFWRVGVSPMANQCTGCTTPAL